jgi:hypothetical protein
VQKRNRLCSSKRAFKSEDKLQRNPEIVSKKKKSSISICCGRFIVMANLLIEVAFSQPVWCTLRVANLEEKVCKFLHLPVRIRRDISYITTGTIFRLLLLRWGRHGQHWLYWIGKRLPQLSSVARINDGSFRVLRFQGLVSC